MRPPFCSSPLADHTHASLGECNLVIHFSAGDVKGPWEKPHRPPASVYPSAENGILLPVGGCLWWKWLLLLARHRRRFRTDLHLAWHLGCRGARSSEESGQWGHRLEHSDRYPLIYRRYSVSPGMGRAPLLAWHFVLFS